MSEFEKAKNEKPNFVYEVTTGMLTGGIGPEAIGGEFYSESRGFYYNKEIAEQKAATFRSGIVRTHKINDIQEVPSE